MNLSQIKEEVLHHFTIDDTYVDPSFNFLKEHFTSILNTECSFSDLIRLKFEELCNESNDITDQKLLKEFIESEEFKNELSSLNYLEEFISDNITNVSTINNVNSNINYDLLIKAGITPKKDSYKLSIEKNRVVNTSCFNIIPKNWKNILSQTLSNPIPKLLRNYIKLENNIVFKGYSNHLSKYPYLECTPNDISTLLAIKIGSITNHFIRSENNEITFGLSGGLSATVSFRKKGKIISEFQNKEFEIFVHRFEVDLDSINHHTLYYQRGYVNSEISLIAPKGYYILTKEFVIEIVLNPAPILCFNNAIKSLDDVSSVTKIEDEEIAAQEQKEQEEQEEQDRRLNDKG